MIAGALAPDDGSVELGASLKMGYFAQQSLDVLNPDLTVIDQLQNDFPQEGLGTLRTLAGAFQFSGDEIDKRIRSLSLSLSLQLSGRREIAARDGARMLYDPPNFLVLDEPTRSHLDLATKEMLVDALRKGFEGTMIFSCRMIAVFPARAGLTRAGTGRRERNGSRAAGISRDRTSSTCRRPGTKPREHILKQPPVLLTVTSSDS